MKEYLQQLESIQDGDIEKIEYPYMTTDYLTQTELAYIRRTLAGSADVVAEFTEFNEAEPESSSIEAKPKNSNLMNLINSALQNDKLDTADEERNSADEFEDNFDMFSDNQQVDTSADDFDLFEMSESDADEQEQEFEPIFNPVEEKRDDEYEVSDELDLLMEAEDDIVSDIMSGVIKHKVTSEPEPELDLESDVALDNEELQMDDVIQEASEKKEATPTVTRFFQSSELENDEYIQMTTLSDTLKAQDFFNKEIKIMYDGEELGLAKLNQETAKILLKFFNRDWIVHLSEIETFKFNRDFIRVFVLNLSTN